MRDEQLSKLHKNINQKQELYKNHKKGIWHYVGFIGFLIIIFTILPIIPSILESRFGIGFPISFVGGLIFGLILMIWSANLENPQPPRLSVIEIELYKVLESLKYIESYQEHRNEYLRTCAAKELKKVERRLKYPRVDNFLWTAVVQEYIDNVKTFKINFKKRLIPNLTGGDDDDLIKVHYIIEEFAKYLSSPTISKLKDLNNDLSKLNKYNQKYSQLKTIIKHPYINHFYLLIFSISVGYFVFRLGPRVGVSIDAAYQIGITLPLAMVTLYLKFIIKRTNN